MNLIALRKTSKNPNITLDKINKFLKKTAKSFNYELKIYQTNSEPRAVNIINSHRNRVSKIILFPGPWQSSAYIIKDIIKILNIPLITISTGEPVNLLNGIFNYNEDDIYKSIEKTFSTISNNN
jgi:3-dehydroquinate dehydratase